MLNEVLNQAREKEEASRNDFEARNKRMMKEAKLRDEWKKGYLLPKTRNANIEDYKKWLKGFLEAGNKPTHVYDYKFSRWDWYIALTDLELKPLYGSQAINIIVPENIKVTGDSGHSLLYFMKDFTSNSSVPIFNDIQFEE